MDWNSLRNDFPVTQQLAFLDHAGVSPPPKPALQVLNKFASELSSKGSALVGHWVHRSEDARKSIAKLVRIDPSNIGFVANTTNAIGIVADGFPWQRGDNVVLPEDEYPSNQYPWLNLEGRGVEVRRVPTAYGNALIDRLQGSMDGRSRMVAISWVGYASGQRVDLDAIGSLCQARKAFLFVDIIQGLGAVPLNLSDSPIDFAACGSHKWLLGYQGAGFLYARPGLLEVLHPRNVGAHSVVDPFNYSRIDFTLKPDASRWEGGTLNFGGIAAWGAAVELLNAIGPGAISNRIRDLTDYLCQQAPRAGLSLANPRSEGTWSGIGAFETPGRDTAEVVRQCKHAGVIVNLRGGWLRVAPHCYNNFDDIDRLLDAAKP